MMSNQYSFLIFMLLVLEISFCQESNNSIENNCQKTDAGISEFCKGENSAAVSFICSNIAELEYVFKNVDADVEELVIQDSTVSLKHPIEWNSKLKHLVFNNCSIKHSAMKWLYSLKNLSSLTIEKCFNHKVTDHSGNTVTALYLKIKPLLDIIGLKIEGCNITDLNVSGVKDLSNLQLINLSGNSFECSRDYLWLYELYTENKQPKVKLDRTICFMEKLDENITFQALYTLRNKPFLAVIEYKMEVAVNCPGGCSCEFIGMHTVDRPLLSVNCIGLNLTNLPSIIPKGSSRFNFTKNLIEDLSPLYTNHLYKKVSFMDLSYNKISYLDPVNFVEVLKQQPRGVGFNLDHNKLSKFPAEIMLRVFKELKYMPQFFLGHNPWLCTCDYIAHFQQLIYYYLYDIKDAGDIRCSDDDPYNAGKIVLSVNTRDLCFTEPLFHTVDLINLMLALILLLLISDFAYNYRQYRKHRKLPWIITKFKC